MVYWISLILTLFIAILIFRVIVRQDYIQHGKLGPLAVFLEFVIFGLHANLPYLYLGVPWPALPPLPEDPVQLYLGLGTLILGLLATLAIMAHLGFGTTLGQHPGEVRQSGPYRLTRNPQILAFGVILLGFGIMYPSLQTAAWVLSYAAIGHMMILTEEEHLKNQFGDQYLDYCSRVPRYAGRPTGKHAEKTEY